MNTTTSATCIRSSRVCRSTLLGRQGVAQFADAVLVELALHPVFQLHRVEQQLPSEAHGVVRACIRNEHDEDVLSRDRIKVVVEQQSLKLLVGRTDG